MKAYRPVSGWMQPLAVCAFSACPESLNEKTMDIVIKEIGQEDIGKMNTMDAGNEVRSKIVPILKDGVFSFQVAEIEKPYLRNYPDNMPDFTTYIGNRDKTAFLAFIGDQAAGQIILKKWWNGFPWVEDIRVDSRHRRKGIGSNLMDSAANWARKNGYPGIMLETQDTNVPACLFYQKYGFILGGMDRMLYHSTVSSGETALFWYFIFSPAQTFQFK